MKCIRNLSAAVAISAIAVASPALAQNVGNNAGIWWNPAPGQPSAFTFLNPLSTVYGRVGFLLSFNSAPSLTGASVDSGVVVATPDRWGGMLGLGVRLMPVLRYELQLGGEFNAQSPITQNGAPVSQTYFRQASVQLMNNVYLDVAPFFGNNLWGLNPYVFGGIGVSWNSTGDVVNVGIPIPGTSRTRMQFAWNGGAGVQWQAMRNLILDVNYRYLDSGRFGLNPATGFGAPATTSRVSAHQIMFSLIVPVDGLIRGIGN